MVTQALHSFLFWAKKSSLQPSTFFKIHFNITLSSTPRYSKKFSFIQNSKPKFCMSHACYMPRPSHPSSFDNPNNIWWIFKADKINTHLNEQLTMRGTIKGNFPTSTVKVHFPPVHVMEAHRGDRGMALLILNLVTWRMWVVRLKTRPLYSCWKNHHYPVSR